MDNNVWYYYRYFSKFLSRYFESLKFLILHKGVTKLVSEIVSDEPKNDNLILIGMAQWGKTSMREKLVVITIFN